MRSLSTRSYIEYLVRLGDLIEIVVHVLHLFKHKKFDKYQIIFVYVILLKEMRFITDLLVIQYYISFAFVKYCSDDEINAQ